MTKTELVNRCITILSQTKVGGMVSEQDKLFLISVFKNHSEWQPKQGCGVDFITTMKTKYGNKCFVIYRIDGTFTDISFMHSLKERSDVSKVKLACRNAISDLIVSFRNSNVVYGVTKCAVTRNILTEGDVHIDHYDITFAEMFSLWIKDKDIKQLILALNPTTDGNVETYFTDKAIVNDFIDFHNRHCKLRAVTKFANLVLLTPTNTPE